MRLQKTTDGTPATLFVSTYLTVQFLHRGGKETMTTNQFPGIKQIRLLTILNEAGMVVQGFLGAVSQFTVLCIVIICVVLKATVTLPTPFPILDDPIKSQHHTPPPILHLFCYSWSKVTHGVVANYF
jgi:hypothetical protein